MKKYLFIAIALGLVCFGFQAKQAQAAATNVYYSVGQTTSTHMTGSPTLTISGGVGTFSVPQTATNTGIGDAGTYNTNQVAYISGKQSTSVWTLVTATGTTPTNITSSTVVSITHAFASLAAATRNVSGPDYMATSSLVGGNYILNLPCYYDSGPDTSAVTISSAYVTGPSNYISIYTPTSTASQVNQSQRHGGVWTSNAYQLEVTNANALTLETNYVAVDGLQIELVNTSGSSYHGAVYIYPSAATSSVSVSNSFLVGAISGGTAVYAGIYGDYVNSVPGSAKIWDNVIYGFNASSSDYGLYLRTGIPWDVYSNTIATSTTGIKVSLALGGSIIAKDNLIISAATVASGTFASGTDYNATDQSSMGYTVTGSGNTHDRTSQTFSFVNAGASDYMLTASDTGSLGHGEDLSADPNLAFGTDANGLPRTDPWDMGAYALDTTAPVVTAFAMPTSSLSLTVPVTTLTAADPAGVTEYLITTFSSTPSYTLTASKPNGTTTATTSVAVVAAISLVQANSTSINGGTTTILAFASSTRSGDPIRGSTLGHC